jgi:hypothetical protein
MKTQFGLTQRTIALAVVEILGLVLLAAGGIPLLDGMPVLPFPTSTLDAVACVIIGAALTLFATVQMIRILLQQTWRDAQRNYP